MGMQGNSDSGYGEKENPGWRLLILSLVMVGIGIYMLLDLLAIIAS